MAYKMIVTLTDAEYDALSAEAEKSGKPLESFLHELLTQHVQLSASETRHLSSREIQEYLYREGLIEHIPTGQADTPQEEAERKRLAQLFGQGKLASEMVIEDRGPQLNGPAYGVGKSVMLSGNTTSP
jgi:site-specific recombinase XerD